MKKLLILAVASVLIFASCKSSPKYSRKSVINGTVHYYYSVPEELWNYSETFTVPRLTAYEIYVKTYLWVLGQSIYWKIEENEDGNQYLRSPQAIYNSRNIAGWQVPNNSGLFSKVEASTENGLVLKTKFSVLHGDRITPYFNLTDVSFHIQNEQCKLVMSYEYGKETSDPNMTVERDRADKWKTLAKGYREYIAAPALPQSEIEGLIANGNAAFMNNDFYTAEINYRKALQSDPFNADILAAYGLCFEELYAHESEKWRPNTGEDAYLIGGSVEYSYLGRLRQVLKNDNEFLPFAMDMYNIALSIDPDNELARMFAEQNKLQKDVNSNRLAQVNKEIEPINAVQQAESRAQREQQEAERKQREAEQQRQEAERLAELKRQQDENWARFNESLGQLSNSIAQFQQSRSGNTGGGNTGGQAQSGTSGGSSSSGSSSRSNSNYDIAQARRTYDAAADTADKAWHIVDSGNDNSGSSSGSFKDAQRRMRRIREEAARNGYTIRKSDWEDKSLPNR
jgi:hypothetical protein